MDVGNQNEQQSAQTFYPVEGTPLDKAITSGASHTVEGMSSQIEAMIGASPVSAASESVGSQHPLTSVLPSLQQQIVNAGILSDAFPLQFSNQQAVVNNSLMTSVGNLLQLSVALPPNQQIVRMATSPNIQLQLPATLLAGQDADNASITIRHPNAKVPPSVPASSANQTVGNPIVTPPIATPPVTTESLTVSHTPASTPVSQSQPVNTNITTSGSNPLQVSVRTNGSVNQTLLSNIVNSQAVQSLLRDHPGQPITIVRMPQTVQQVPAKLSFPQAPISNANLGAVLKGQKRNGAPLSAPRGRRPRKIREPERPEDKSKFVEFQKSLQTTTRSGRVSKPPMYRVKETLPTPVNSDQGQQDKGESGKVAEDDASVERSPLDATGQATTNNLRGFPSSRRGHRGYNRGRRRARGRIGNHGNREPLTKIEQLLIRASDEDFISLVSPRLCQLLSPWDFMLMRAFRRKKMEPDKTEVVPLIKRVLGEFQQLVSNMRKLSRQCLVTGRSSAEGQQSKLDIPPALYGALGMRGRFYIKEIPKELLTSRVISFSSDITTDEVVSDADNLSTNTTTSLTDTDVTTEEAILGVESIDPENTTKKLVRTAKAGIHSVISPKWKDMIDKNPDPEASIPPSCTTPQIAPSNEDDTGMIVNVEEIETSEKPKKGDEVTSDIPTQSSDVTPDMPADGGDVTPDTPAEGGDLNQIQARNPVCETMTTEQVESIVKENLMQALPGSMPLHSGGTTSADALIPDNGPTPQVLDGDPSLQEMQTVHGGETLPSAGIVNKGGSLSSRGTLQHDPPMLTTQTSTEDKSLPNEHILRGADSISDDQALHEGDSLPVAETIHEEGALPETENLVDASLTLQETDAVYEEPMEASSAAIDAMVTDPLQPNTSPMVPGSLQPTTSPMVPVGSTIMQMADGNFLVQKPDGTAMQIHAPEGMTIETIQALLTVETEVSEQPTVQPEHAVDDQDYPTVDGVT